MKSKVCLLISLLLWTTGLAQPNGSADTILINDVSIFSTEIDHNQDSWTSIYILDARLDKRVARLEKHLRNKSSTSNYRIIAISHKSRHTYRACRSRNCRN